MKHLFGLWLAAICVGLAGLSSSARGQDPALESRARIGWNGTYVVGRWADVVVDFDAPQAGDYEVRVTASDPDGHRVTFVSSTRSPQGRHPLRGYFKAGQLDAPIEVTVVASGAETPLRNWKSSRQPGANGARSLNPGSRLIVTVGSPPGFDEHDARPAWGAPRFLTVDLPVADLPVQARSYDAVALLVVAGNSIVSPEQASAVRDWVTGGGRLVISLPKGTTSVREFFQPFAGWLPVTLSAEPITISEFGKLEYFAGKNVRIPFVGRMPIPGVKISQGEVLAGSRDEALLVRAPIGLGSATVLALDLTQPPLSTWTGLPSLGRRLAESPESATTAAGPSRNLQLSSTGITDLATQLHAVQEDFEGVTRASPWFVLGLMTLFLLVIGPLDYVVVHRLLKWPRGTWLTLPAWVILGAVLSANLASHWNGHSPRINQLNVLNFDVDTSTCHQRLWTNLYSPETGRRSVEVRSAIGTESASSRQSGWSGVAESVFGGMLRPAGIQIGAGDYQLSSSAAIAGLPVMQWSSKPLVTEIHSTVAGLVESDLQSNGVGQLSGTLTHRLPGPIEDWMLAYGNRVYRHKQKRYDDQSLPLAPRQVLRLDQPNVFPRELRAFLTGRYATGVQQTGSSATDVIDQYTAYDPLSRAPGDVVRILTFHEEVGGAKYTGLTNRLLEHEDLSHLLKLGRAILFGRLQSSVADVRLDGTAVTPDRETTFIRIVLPVKNIGGDVHRPLERLDQ